MNKYLEIAPEVREALAAGKPVVALESTIISHGMPYPQNVETALNVERIVRENGAVPATIAIIGGKLKAGLSRDEIEYLGKKGYAVTKASRRDLPVLVVCAGAKSILDLGLTLEYLETKGVPVIGYGTEELPAFYTRRSGFGVDYRLDTPDEVAAAFRAKLEMGLQGGMLVTNPIPEEFSMDPDVINRAIDEAVAEANAQGIKGKQTTPFLLAKIKDITGGDSLASNIRLVYNNAALAAQVAGRL